MRQCAGVVKCFQVQSINDFSHYVNLKRRDLKVEREPAEIDRWEERRRAERQRVC